MRYFSKTKLVQKLNNQIDILNQEIQEHKELIEYKKIAYEEVYTELQNLKKEYELLLKKYSTLALEKVELETKYQTLSNKYTSDVLVGISNFISKLFRN